MFCHHPSAHLAADALAHSTDARADAEPNAGPGAGHAGSDGRENARTRRRGDVRTQVLWVWLGHDSGTHSIRLVIWLGHENPRARGDHLWRYRRCSNVRGDAVHNESLDLRRNVRCQTVLYECSSPVYEDAC